ncbi:BREX system Lon protease-like protein BrxL [Candidatus Bathyarchaeota archaeon]|nr:MAG: BREX system Lon protease-like protein BrxL [Candidatus Bathyarchaeota archaeon]
MTEDLNTKIRSVFGEVAVDKGLATRHEVSRLPRFISEYLISRYCNLYHDVEVAFNKLSQVVSENFPEPKDKDRIFYKLKRQGIIRIMDEFKVSVDLKRNIYRLHIPCLQIYDAIADEGTVRRYERILSGMWGLGTLEYRPDILEIEDIKVSPIILIDIEPFQVYNINHKDFIEARSHFSLTEWINLLINTIGLNPSAYNNRQKMLLLARLIPLIEGNVNMMEFGPRATGKTYLYRNLSYYTRIYSGGSVSPARLFYDARIRVIGDLGTHDLIVFDEISKIRFTNPDEMAGKLKDFMVDGFFERGTLKRAHSDCSLVFLGNIEIGGRTPAEQITTILPNVMRDSAFMDRIHGILPGWELPKIMKSEEHLAKGLGLAADYFAEIVHELRKESFKDIIDNHVELVGNYTIRDENAVKKIASGLIKILFPNREFNNQELREVMNLSVEMRQAVANQLSEMSPGEFPRKELSFRVLG